MSEEKIQETQLPANPILAEFQQFAQAFKEQETFAGKAVISYAMREKMISPKADTVEKVAKEQEVLFSQALQIERLKMDKDNQAFDHEMRREKLKLEQEEARRRNSALVLKMKDNPAMLIGAFIASQKSVVLLEAWAESVFKTFFSGYGYDGDLEGFRRKCLSVGDADAADLASAFITLISKAKNS